MSHLGQESGMTRRDILRAMAGLAGTPLWGPLVTAQTVKGSVAYAQVSQPVPTPGLPSGISFKDVARPAGIKHQTIFGSEVRDPYLLESTGCGVAFFDYDNDGWLDVFFVNGSRVEGFPKGQEPTNRLYKNNRDGTFTDVTEKAGLVHTGWGQGCCIGDYDNDGFDDLFVTYWGKNVLYHNNGDGTFTDVSAKAGVAGDRVRWGTGCAFLDYDLDGRLDLFVANYVDIPDLKSWPLPNSGPCLYKGTLVACGPTGLPGAKNILYHNNGDGTFTDVSEKAGILKANGTYGLGVLVADFDNDGWPDIYVANDSQPSALYKNNHDGTFTDVGIMAGCAYSQDGQPQAGMGPTAGDYDCDGWLDIFRTDFSEDTPSLYHNLGKSAPGFDYVMFDNVTFPAGLGINTRYMGWGCGFFDLDNDGWQDIFVANGHIYPEIERLHIDIHYKQPKNVYYNLRNGRFADISNKLGEAVLRPVSARGCAFGDFDNDGDVDVAINPVNDSPELLRCDSPGPAQGGNHWLKVKLIGTRSNRSAIGARVTCITGDHRQIDEVRSGGSWASQNDLRIHFGLGGTAHVDKLEIRWPSGTVDSMEGIEADRIITVEEGKGIADSINASAHGAKRR